MGSGQDIGQASFQGPYLSRPNIVAAGLHMAATPSLQLAWVNGDTHFAVSFPALVAYASLGF